MHGPPEPSTRFQIAQAGCLTILGAGFFFIFSPGFALTTLVIAFMLLATALFWPKS